MFSCGEAVSVAVMSHALRRAGVPSIGMTSVQARIYTDGHHQEAEIVRIETTRLHRLMAAGHVPVITGDQGIAPGTRDYTTLGRGGSDTSAVALGVALRARRVELFTDVPGVAATDPRLVPEARMLSRVSYGAMSEMARFGANVLHPRALTAGRNARIPIVVRSTFSHEPGTLIGDVADDGPVVSLSLLPAMETIVLARGSVPLAAREVWEQRSGVMSLIDSGSGVLIVGASVDKMADLDGAREAASVAPLRRLGRCCWLSVVGESLALRDRIPSDRALFAQLGVGVFANEAAERRSTYVIPDAAGATAVQALYRDIFG